MSWLRSYLPGLILIAIVTVASFFVALLPRADLVGPLVLALTFGLIVGQLRPIRNAGLPSSGAVRFAATTLLKVGIVLLGVRLDVRTLASLGPWVVSGSVLGVATALLVTELVGRAWRIPVDLRRAVAIGTAVCGASAIAAAIPVLRARAEHASIAIATISLLGTVGVLGFALFYASSAAGAAVTAMLAGATLQEVGHVVAVGISVGGPEGDLALLVKLSRVVLLAPTLLVLSFATRGAAAKVGVRAPLVPAFVIGFLALGVATSTGWIPVSAVQVSATVGTWLTAAAMAAIGLGVDLRSIGSVGRPALALGVTGFAALLGTMALYYRVVPF